LGTESGARSQFLPLVPASPHPLSLRSIAKPHGARALQAPHEAVYNCLVAARPAERLDGSRQDAFPIEAVRRSG
jgi:hypothetical protein